jgi:putative ABC transport system ATP-binding protein
MNNPVAPSQPSNLPVFQSSISSLFSAEGAADKHGFVIRAVDVKKVFKMGDSETHALRGASLDVKRGEYLSIMGPSGSGKTTFFNMIGGLDKPTSGKVYMDQVDIAQLDPYELAWLRCRKVGYVFQTFNLIQVMSCIENVTLPMSFAGMGDEEAREKAIEILERVGLKERALHKPGEMSGGQQQRVAIARALANSPDIILADEPTGNLDLKTGEEIINLFSQLRTELGVTIITATHDLKMLKASDRIVWIEDGLITRVTTADAIDIQVQEIH